MTTITFTGDNARLVKLGLKTQTRRIISEKDKDKLLLDATWKYRVGDKLVVREPWKIIYWDMESPKYKIQFKDGSVIEVNSPEEYSCEDERYHIQCSDDCDKAGLQIDSDGYYILPKEVPTRWRSPRFMPKWASRMTIEVTGIRVERLQEITEEDAKAEGLIVVRFGNQTEYGFTDKNGNPKFWLNPVHTYSALWESIHGNGSWKLNPHVWVIEFKVIN